MNIHYKNLINYVDELIIGRSESDYYSFILNVDDLDDDELSKLSAFFIELDERDTYECFHNPDQYAKDDDITCALLKLLIDNSDENKKNLSDLILKRSVQKYKSQIQEIIDERCALLFESNMNDKGYYKDHYKDNNEVFWRKSA